MQAAACLTEFGAWPQAASVCELGFPGMSLDLGIRPPWDAPALLGCDSFHSDTHLSFHSDTHLSFHSDTHLSFHSDTHLSFHSDTHLSFHSDSPERNPEHVAVARVLQRVQVVYVGHSKGKQ